MNPTKEPQYPDYICHVCGEAYGGWYKRGTYIGPPHHCATYHNGTCGICGATDVPVTQPRDYGHLRAKWKGEIMRSRENN